MKYNRGKYGQFLYGGTFGFASYTPITKPTTDYTVITRPSTGWGISLLHTYGLEAEKTTRILYGDHVLFGGIPKVDYKFVEKANFSTDY